MDDGIDENAEIAQAIVESGLQSFGIDGSNRDWQGKASSNDLEKARSTIRQLYRDVSLCIYLQCSKTDSSEWSLEGAAEREACYDLVIKDLKEERKIRSGPPLQVLVPGAGLGRLVFELCCAGFDAEGNEISYHQLLASEFPFSWSIIAHCYVFEEQR